MYGITPINTELLRFSNFKLQLDLKNEKQRQNSGNFIFRFLFQPPVPVRKPLVFPNSGANPKVYQYYSLDEVDVESPNHEPVSSKFDFSKQISRNFAVFTGSILWVPLPNLTFVLVEKTTGGFESQRNRRKGRRTAWKIAFERRIWRYQLEFGHVTLQISWPEIAPIGNFERRWTS